MRKFVYGFVLGAVIAAAITSAIAANAVTWVDAQDKTLGTTSNPVIVRAQ